ncbi:DUF4249 domain-containing protein [Spirosoma sp. KUDC1026]|uniref:DUF4249 domain-containing protein n=1 Tax=Spirosoma sp. KUDC1026 TaxID=2745947 RepID=UPI00159BAF40|nr:DUF4249 domain-containing protein [Spirosoma sp. KUDC1026]QKZ15579.1 DUF4249 domain-containing protein [Spirosoma sp. KUDC1026]
MNLQYGWWLIGCLFLLTGCGSLRTEVNPEFLNRESGKLVVTGFLSPQDTVLAVKVSRSRTVLGDSINTGATQNIQNAVVTIQEGGRLVALNNKNNTADYYSIEARFLPIIAGRTYKLVVQTPGGERAESSCTIPSIVRLDGIAFDSAIINQFFNQQKRYYVHASWTDQPNQANYYQLTGLFQFINADSAGRREYRNVRFDAANGSLQSDENRDGDQIFSERAYISRIDVNSPAAQRSFSSRFRDAIVTVNLLNIEKTYYQYQTAAGLQAQSSGNPFAEPVLIPSNIQGGLGCFAGYNRSTMRLRVSR